MADIKCTDKMAHCTILTPKGILSGYSALFEPSTKFNKKGIYNASIILSKEEGEKILEIVKEVQKEQFKRFKTGKQKLAEIATIKPLSIIDEETGEEIFDEEGRYILKAKASARINEKDNTIGYRVAVFDAKLKPVKKVMLGEGSIIRLKIDIQGYSVADKIGVSLKLIAAQIINFVEYTGNSNAAEGFEIEDGYEFGEVTEESVYSTNEDEIPF